MRAAIEAGRTHPGDLILDTDVVVIGSGSGGAVAACVLAEAGHEVVVLEEGPHVPEAVYAGMRPSETMRRMWRENGLTFALGLGNTPSINVAMGRCIGGSSPATGGVAFRIPDAVLEGWVREHGLDGLAPERMAPFFDEVEAVGHVEEVPAAMRSRSTALFALGAERTGLPVHPLRRNTKGCRGCGRCNFGCPEHAKQSVDLTWLPRALRAGARIWSDCRVDRVVVSRGRAVGVEGRVLNDLRGGPRGRLKVRAKRVVVAAGAVHSPSLLRRSGVGRRSGQVGRNLSLHPGFRVVARFDEDVDGWRGAMQSAWSDGLSEKGVTLVSIFMPPGPMTGPLPGLGPAQHRLARDYRRLAIFGGIVHDAGGGTVGRVVGREPVIRYRMASQDRAAVPVLLRAMAEAFFAAGAREVYLPILGLGVVDRDRLRGLDLEQVSLRRMECGSQHPLGTCRMGTSPERSVVDPAGRAWDLPNLWVADGSVMPSSLGVNPQIAVMAMALRIAKVIA